MEGFNVPDLEEAPPNKGVQEYSQWISKTRKQLAMLDEARIKRYFNTCLVFVEKYNNALIINYDVRTRDALQYLKFNLRDSSRDEVDIQLMKWFTDNREKFELISNDSAYMNPKLTKLQKMILEAYAKKPDSRVIVFVKTKDLVSAILRWMKETPLLKALYPEKLVGQSSSDLGGMTQNKQVDVLQYFKDGKHKILIATSVAEEGLDIQKCNLVIRYDYVTNVVAMVQARGRGRAEDSEYKVLATKGKGIVEREELNMIREEMMKNAIKELQSRMESDPQLYHEQLLGLQMKAKDGRDLLADRTNNRIFVEGEFEIRCQHCDKMACFSSELRLIESNHRVVVAKDFEDRAKVFLQPSQSLHQGLTLKGKVLCKQCGSDWGIVCSYKGHFYYVIKISNFVVANFDQGRSTHKQWKDVDFKVEAIKTSDYKIIDAISCQLASILKC